MRPIRSDRCWPSCSSTTTAARACTTRCVAPGRRSAGMVRARSLRRRRRRPPARHQGHGSARRWYADGHHGTARLDGCRVAGRHRDLGCRLRANLAVRGRRRCRIEPQLRTAPVRPAPSLAFVRFDSSGQACVFTQQPADLVVDLQGYMAPGSFDDVADARLLDTRAGRRTGQRLDDPAFRQAEQHGGRHDRGHGDIGRGLRAGACRAARSRAGPRT